MAKTKIKKKNRFFLVDYENVHMSGLVGIEELSKSDTVYIFYSANADSLSFEAMKLLSSAKAKIEYVKVSTVGRNALDFQLSSFVGYLLGKYEDARCYIVSNDKGYANVQIFWFGQGERVKLVPCIRDRKSLATKRSDVEKVVEELDLTDEEKENVTELIWNRLKVGSPHLSHIKVGINNDLVQRFGGEKTKVIFNVIRPLIK